MKRLPLLLAFAAGLVALAALGQAGWIWAKAWAARGLIEQAWTETLAGTRQARPWPWADTWPVARLAFPSLDTERLVLEGEDGRALAFGPVTREEGPVRAVFGHRDTHFRVIADLSRGDPVDWIGRDGVPRHYRVADMAVLHKDAVALPQDAPSDALLLITCYPFDALLPDTPLRYVVLASPEPEA